MRHWLHRDDGPSDELGRDMIVAEALESLDPARGDLNYWFRFHGRVMAGAAPELARRRLVSNLTISDVLASWSRTVVPTTMLAAALAALLLIRAGSATMQPEAVVDGVQASEEVVPVMLSGEVPTAFVAFTEIF